MHDRTIVVAGHICLDVIPQFTAARGAVHQMLAPGTLVNVGPAVVATGGTVANVGVALHRLGAPVRLVGKVGQDAFGQSIRQILTRYGTTLADRLVISTQDQTSYTIVISPPGVDRIFLHHPGANDTFCASDVPDRCLDDAVLLHFGYPPLMRAFYNDGGEQAELLLQRVKARGLITSLDMSLPDPQSDAGRIDWRRWLQRVLPQVDVFVPSYDEILFMLGQSAATVEAAVLAGLAEQLIRWGAAIVAIKVGDQGLYVRTSQAKHRVEQAGVTESWIGRELYCPCMQVNVVGTTGSGDCTIAGLLHGLVGDLNPEQAIRAAVAVGACNVEAPDAVSGIRPWAEVQQRLAAGWKQRGPHPAFSRWTAREGIYLGPHDQDARR